MRSGPRSSHLVGWKLVAGGGLCPAAERGFFCTAYRTSAMFSQRDLVAFVLHPACFLILTALAIAAGLSAANAGDPAVSGPNAKFSVEGGTYFGANPATTRIGRHLTGTRKAPRRYSTRAMMANADNCIPQGQPCDPNGPADQCCQSTSTGGSNVELKIGCAPPPCSQCTPEERESQPSVCTLYFQIQTGPQEKNEH